MSRYNKPIKRTWKGIISQALVIAIVTTISVLALPTGDRSVLLVDVDQPWPYGRLIAPFEFPIFKTEAELQKERDSILKTYTPYFELIPNIGDSQIQDFRTSQHYSELSRGYRDYIENRLREVYQQGIMDFDNLQPLQLQNTSGVIVYHGNEAVTIPISKVYSEKSAYQYLVEGSEEQQINKQKLIQLDLNKYISPNLEFDDSKSKSLKDDIEHTITPSSGIVVAGQNIIDRGDIVTEDTYKILYSYNKALQERGDSKNEGILTILGKVLLVVTFLVCLTFYFNLFRRDYITNFRSVFLLMVLVLMYQLITSFLVRMNFGSVYLIPYAMLPIFIRVFMDSRTAFFVHTITILLCAVALRAPYEFIVTQLVAGLVAIYSIRELSERSQIIRTAAFVTLAALIVYTSIDLIHGHSFYGNDSLTKVDWEFYIHIVISGFLLLLAYLLMPLLERAFGFISNVTLVEMSDTNHELLRRLSETAPGTFQHSMQVANLAAEVANKIGAKSQLVRTGALYHDIGKLNNPEYFTENQLGGINPHRLLSNKESAAIILRHVNDGEELADRYRLPRIIRDFITTHHGTGLAKYFFITEQNEHPDQQVDPEDYRYKGKNPSTLEQAILMMTDAVEASARSLKEYTGESIGQLVDKIIDGQVADGFFKECPITFQDIATAKEVLKEKLRTIYHTRVSYPTLTIGYNKSEINHSGSTSK